MVITHPSVPGRSLWVYAHPYRDSLNGRLFAAGTEALSEQYDVRASDLYEMEFDPVLSSRDLGDLAGRRGGFGRLFRDACRRGQTPSDVQGEQAKLAAAELIVLQFPLWWYGPPAILKGWFDRVLTSGFAFGDKDPVVGGARRYGDGGLAGRRALVIVTAGEQEAAIGSRGVSGDLDSLLFPLMHGTLWYVGIESLALHVIDDAYALTSSDIDHQVARLTARLRGLAAEPTVPFRRLRDGDYREAQVLRDDLLPGRLDFGIHRR